jgi:hypothetical protein
MTKQAVKSSVHRLCLPRAGACFSLVLQEVWPRNVPVATELCTDADQAGSTGRATIFEDYASSEIRDLL